MSKEHAQSFVERFFEDDEFVKEVLVHRGFQKHEGNDEEAEKEAKRKKKKALEDAMNANGLSEYEKEIVRRGEADPWDFEEENLEEGDYYEDDID